MLVLACETTGYEIAVAFLGVALAIAVVIMAVSKADKGWDK